jgi:translation initiation factor 3 subunit E
MASTTTSSPPAAKATARPDPQYDLISKLSPFLDVHFLFPMLAFNEALGVFEPADLLAAKLSLLNNTNMVDYAIQEMSKNKMTPASEMLERRQAVVDTLERLSKEAGVLVSLVADEGEASSLAEARKLAASTYGGDLLACLEGTQGVTPAVMESFFTLSKFHFECGNYLQASKLLKLYTELDRAQSLDTLWGKLASRILRMSWEEDGAVDSAIKDIQEIQRILDSRDSDPLTSPNHLEQLQLRGWLLHWSLFVFFNSPEGRQQIVDFFTDKKNKNVIELLCPWLTRYVCAAAVANKQRGKHVLKTLAATIELVKYEYRDPVTDFVASIQAQTDFNLERALDDLASCDRLLAGDYFLAGSRQDFMEAARALVFETHCRVTSRVDIKMLSSKLDLSQDDAERWIVDLVRSAKLDARIDLESGQVLMMSPQVVLWQVIVDKTKDLGTRSQALTNGILAMQKEGLMS